VVLSITDWTVSDVWSSCLSHGSVFESSKEPFWFESERTSVLKWPNFSFRFDRTHRRRARLDYENMATFGVGRTAVWPDWGHRTAERFSERCHVEEANSGQLRFEPIFEVVCVEDFDPRQQNLLLDVSTNTRAVWRKRCEVNSSLSGDYNAEANLKIAFGARLSGIRDCSMFAQDKKM